MVCIPKALYNITLLENGARRGSRLAIHNVASRPGNSEYIHG